MEHADRRLLGPQGQRNEEDQPLADAAGRDRRVELLEADGGLEAARIHEAGLRGDPAHVLRVSLGQGRQDLALDGQHRRLDDAADGQVLQEMQEVRGARLLQRRAEVLRTEPPLHELVDEDHGVPFLLGDDVGLDGGRDRGDEEGRHAREGQERQDGETPEQGLARQRADDVPGHGSTTMVPVAGVRFCRATAWSW